MSTGFSGAERGNIRIADTVAVFAQGPIGLCATAGAKLLGATTIIAVESVPARREVSRRLGADHVVIDAGGRDHRHQAPQAYDLFAHQRDGVLKVGITP